MENPPRCVSERHLAYEITECCYPPPDTCKRVSPLQWRRYTRASKVKWPSWKIHRPGSRPALVNNVYVYSPLR